MKMHVSTPVFLGRLLTVAGLAAVLAIPSAAFAERGPGHGSDDVAQEVEMHAGTDDAQPTPDPGLALSIVEPAQGGPTAWAFAPTQLTVAVGSTVVWTNTGSTQHTVTSTDGVSFDSGAIDPNGTFSFTPTAAGTYTYVCQYHTWMTGTLTVS
jgi:plastocyanin